LSPITDIFVSVGFDSGSPGPYHARAMGNPLRDRRRPSDLAAESQVIDFNQKLAVFDHLAEIVEADLEALDSESRPRDWRDALVSGRLEFGFADAQQQFPALTGRIEASIDAVCQRCLGPMRLPLAVDLQLVFAADNGTGHDHGPHEVWELDEEQLRPLDVIEESLIMALPFAASHSDQADCTEAPVGKSPAGDMTRPFADLRAHWDEEN
jgi:uncharacterized metal-binding protein YceD (DUF177 family)